ncbi:MAG: hypothetical protein IPK11_17740 [Ignavibacteria bacterium]|nr:hypothetical protein [Ignavibacteria bacterium]
MAQAGIGHSSCNRSDQEKIYKALTNNGVNIMRYELLLLVFATIAFCPKSLLSNDSLFYDKIIREKVTNVIDLTYAYFELESIHESDKFYEKGNIVSRLNNLSYDKRDSTYRYVIEINEVKDVNFSCLPKRFKAYEFRYLNEIQILVNRYGKVNGKIANIGKHWINEGMHMLHNVYERNLDSNSKYDVRLLKHTPRNLVLVDTLDKSVIIASNLYFADDLDFLLKDSTILSDIECYIKLHFYTYRPTDIVVVDNQNALFYSELYKKKIEVFFSSYVNKYPNVPKPSVEHYYDGSRILK